MKLLNFDNYQLKIADEALLVRPIRELYRKDKSKDKENFYEQMSYLYFMVDPRSTYGYIIDDALRAKAIIEQEISEQSRVRGTDLSMFEDGF